VTALAVAGAGGSPVAPDLVLPPGFDRLGDVVRFAQVEVGAQPCFASETRRPSAVLAAPPPAPAQDSGPTLELAAGLAAAAHASHSAPAGEGQEPALLDDQLAALRPKTAARVRRYLASRGSLTAFCAAEGVSKQGFHSSLRYMIDRGGPLAEAIDARKEGRGGLAPIDLVPCTLCGLRGHLAGDPDRCLYYRGSFGLGGQAAQAQGGH
jgi:hypothetical protein